MAAQLPGVAQEIELAAASWPVFSAPRPGISIGLPHGLAVASVADVAATWALATPVTASGPTPAMAPAAHQQPPRLYAISSVVPFNYVRFLVSPAEPWLQRSVCI